MILVSCDLSNPRENSSIDDFIDSDELTTILEIKIDLDDKIIDALNTGMSIHLLKRSLLEGEINQFYKFIKIDPEKISQMNDDYFTAIDQLSKKYPQFVNQNKNSRNGRINEINLNSYFSDLQDRYIIPTRSNNPKTQTTKKAQVEKEKRKWFDGCKKVALGACTMGCGLTAPTVIGAVVCGYGCYCGFCEGDRNGVCY